MQTMSTENHRPIDAEGGDRGEGTGRGNNNKPRKNKGRLAKYLNAASRAFEKKKQLGDEVLPGGEVKQRAEKFLTDESERSAANVKHRDEVILPLGDDDIKQRTEKDVDSSCASGEE